MGSRREGRILAFQALYALDTAEDKITALKDLLDFSWAEKKPVNLPGEKQDAALLGMEALDGVGTLHDTQAGGDESAADIFPRLLLTGTVENIEAVDAMIRSHLLHWDFSRLGRVDRALLRLSVYELLFKVAPPSVVIDEAVDISREYGTDDSYRFINGVLDGVRKTIERTGKER
jgi:N utilization substance protein B